MAKVYVTHTCKNRKCKRAFIAEDTYNADVNLPPPKDKYCPQCVRKGYKNK